MLKNAAKVATFLKTAKLTGIFRGIRAKYLTRVRNIMTIAGGSAAVISELGAVISLVGAVSCVPAAVISRPVMVISSAGAVATRLMTIASPPAAISGFQGEPRKGGAFVAGVIQKEPATGAGSPYIIIGVGGYSPKISFNLAPNASPVRSEAMILPCGSISTLLGIEFTPYTFPAAHCHPLRSDI